MPIITDMKVFGYNKNGDAILEPAETCLCPKCKRGILKVRSRVRRHIKKEDTGAKEWYQIPVGKCSDKSCCRMTRMLPDKMVPFKHYEEAVIKKVLDGEIAEETPIDFPSTQTLRRWIAWLLFNADRIEGILRGVGYQILGYGKDFLFDTNSLLTWLRRETEKWLKITIRFVYNSGNCLLPL